eukprot:TRINITY_DN45003_c0_g1_i1.p1 TRINITY_DN45003_c0_g1~~TRINITY_DN45003_c0_g1_i1.p1  ORF type:complete len:334 (+),score=44.71 TRINITY_DN45003_c0_g1_i1:158-1159(+)
MGAPGGNAKGKGVAPPPPPASSRPPLKAAPAARTWPRVQVSEPSTGQPRSHGHDQGGLSVSLSDNLGVLERAQEIFSREPAVERRPAVLASSTSVSASFDAAHGTTLAAALSAFRNTNGQLVPVQMLEQLGNLRTTGATPECYFEDDSENALRHVVFAADLQFGAVAINTAERYAMGESGASEGKLVGSRAIRRSEAALIPVILIGRLVDPKGLGAKTNKLFEPLFNPSAEMAAMHGRTPEEFRMALAGQVVGEWFDIRMLFVAHPTDPGKDLAVMDLVKELLRRAATEQGCHFGDVRVGSLRNLAAVKDAIPSALTSEDIRRLLNEATAPLP